MHSSEHSDAAHLRLQAELNAVGAAFDRTQDAAERQELVNRARALTDEMLELIARRRPPRREGGDRF